MSVRLLGASAAGKAIIHTALDDLESFLWLLIWGIIYASKDIEGARDANEGIKLMLDTWSGNANSNIAKHVHALSWKDAVFGDLIREWLGIFVLARRENDLYTEGMSKEELGSPEWTSICDDFKSYCKGIYGEVLESGFKHLNALREYSDWKEVVAAKSHSHWSDRKRLREDQGGRRAEGDRPARYK
jgi:hypothetical protein